MRKIALVVVIVGIIIGYLVVRDSPFEKNSGVPVVNESAVLRYPDPSGATFIFNDGPVTLSAGRNEKAIVSGDGLIEETVLLDKFAYGDINADGKEDAVLFLARYGAGSGTFIYVASFVSGPIAYHGSNVIFIEDRISPQSIAIDNDSITINYLGRAFDEPFNAEPTIPTTRQFIYKDGELQEK